MSTRVLSLRPVLKLLLCFFAAAAILGLAVPGNSYAQSVWGLALGEKQKAPAATVTVEIEHKDSELKGAEKEPDATVKIRVETETKPSGATAPVTILPSPKKQIAPIETDQIDKAGLRVGKTIEEIGQRASYRLGDWVNAKLFFGISWLKLVFFLLSILLVVLSERLLRMILHWSLRRTYANGQHSTWKPVFVEALFGPLRLCIYVYGIYAALSPLFVHFKVALGSNLLHSSAEKAADIGGGIAVIWFCYRMVRIVDIRLRKKTSSAHGKSDDLLSAIVGRTIRFAVAIIGGILILQNLTGIEAGPLIASLGIGGFAVALAAKEPLANIFGTFTVLFDKPFKVGDQIIIEGYNGIVESVGYRSTRLLTLNGHRISVPNQKVISATLENVKERPYIRWLTDISIPYDAPVEKLDRAVEIIEEVLENHERMSKDHPAKVCFTGFKDWSLNLMVCAWYYSNDWWAYHAWLHKTCREIKLRFEEEGIEFAMPTQNVHVEQQDMRDTKPMHGRGVHAWRLRRSVGM